jgi:hypothetical protein
MEVQPVPCFPGDEWQKTNAEAAHAAGVVRADSAAVVVAVEE